MELLDLDIFQLYQELLSRETQASTSNQEGAAFFQSPPQPPMLGGGIGNYVADDGSAMPLQKPGGGICAGNGGLALGETWAAAEDSLMLGGGMFLGNDQSMHGGSFPDLAGGMQELLNDVDLSEFFDGDSAAINSLWMYQTVFVNSLRTNKAAIDPSGVMVYSPPTPPADEVNQPGSNSSGLTQVSADSPGLTSPMGAYSPAMDYPQPPAPSADAPQAVPDNERTEVAQMVRVAVQCGDKVSTVWSEEENQLLREGLSRFADQDNVTKCFNIASGLAKKTALDVAYQIRWLLDLEQKKKAAEQAELGQAKSAGGNVTKGNGTKGAIKKNNMYPLSEEGLDSKSDKDLQRDNDRLMDRIEEILRTGQLKDSANYFFYVKMNMDALQKVSDMGTTMEGLSVDEEEWEDVLKDRSSSAGKDTTTPP